MQEVWLSCQALLSHGSSHRPDGYMALALFADFLLPTEMLAKPKDTPDIDLKEEFDLRNQLEFWEALKSGLV
jgi:hypothetical protein